MQSSLKYAYHGDVPWTATKTREESTSVVTLSHAGLVRVSAHIESPLLTLLVEVANITVRYGTPTYFSSNTRRGLCQAR